MKNTDLYKQIERLKSMIDEGVLDESEIELAENKISALKAQTEKNFETEPEKTTIKEENQLNNEERILDQNEIESAENKTSAPKAQIEKNFETEPKKNIIKEENKLNNDEKKISNEQHFAKELEDDEIQKSETTENNFASTNPLTVGHGFLNRLVEKSFRDSERIICVKGFFFIIVYFIIAQSISEFIDFNTGYGFLVFFPFFSLSVILFVVYIIRMRRVIQERKQDDIAILKYFSNKELGFFLFLVLGLIWFLSEM
mgnify:CR=1 FL=1